MNIAHWTDPPESRMLLHDISWETFEELANERSGSVPRMTYDQGHLELISPLRQHENIGCLIGRLVETYTEVREIEIQSVASTTFKRADLQKAFEADESYYVTNAELIRPKKEVDLDSDPPPDLVIEVEITSSAILKMNLFAKMGVPEVWRHNGEHLQMNRLTDGDYVPIESSIEIPGLTLATIEHWLGRRFDIGETKLIREFRKSLG